MTVFDNLEDQLDVCVNLAVDEPLDDPDTDLVNNDVLLDVNDIIGVNVPTGVTVYVRIDVPVLDELDDPVCVLEDVVVLELVTD